MSNCIFCHNLIPANRFPRNRKLGSTPKYCSDKCNKAAYYVRKRQFKTSYYVGSTIEDWSKTATGKSYIWEQFVANILKGEWQGFSAPFDVLINGKKIDVKTCNLYKRKYKRGKPVNPAKQAGWFSFHKYDRDRSEKDIDYLFCIGLVKGIPLKMWMIPYGYIEGRDFNITAKYSKRYDRFLVVL